jgi:hypothetical protein
MQASEESGSPKKSENVVEAIKQDRIKKREERRQLQRKIERLEKDIEGVEGEIKQADEILNTPSNASNYGLLHDTAMAFEMLKKKNEKMVIEWEELQGKLAEIEEI